MKGVFMNGFKYKEVYIQDEKRYLEVNILPEKFCNFDCIFCPIGRSKDKTDEIHDFDNYDECIFDLEQKLTDLKPDVLFINSAGEALVHSRVSEIIDQVKLKGVQVKLLSNGYLLNEKNYKAIAEKCDEVIGEIKAVTEVDFKKLVRPIEGYTLEAHISNMAKFNEDYSGKFNLEITIIKGYNDTNEAVEKMSNMFQRIKPDRVTFVTLDGIFEKKLGVSRELLESIEKRLLMDIDG